jgi:hypothetical protein
MEIKTIEELLIIKASLICLRDKYDSIMTPLYITMNDVAINGMECDINLILTLIKKIDTELKRR